MRYTIRQASWIGASVAATSPNIANGGEDLERKGRQPKPSRGLPVFPRSPAIFGPSSSTSDERAQCVDYLDAGFQRFGDITTVPWRPGEERYDMLECIGVEWRLRVTLRVPDGRRARRAIPWHALVRSQTW
jgi:hypothetical protein